MKKMLITTSLSLFVLPAIAQAPQGWVGLQGGYDFQGQKSRGAKDNAIVGVTVGTWFSPHWGADLDLLGTQLKSNVTGNKNDEFHLDASLLLNLAPTLGTWVPYLRAGAGATRVDNPFSFSAGYTNRFNYQGGVGVQAHPGDHLMLGLEAREIRIDTQIAYNEMIGLFTIGYRWGAPAPMPAPVAVTAPAPPPPPPPPPPPVVEPPPPPPEPAPVVVAPPPPPPPPAKIVLDEAVLHFANGKAVIPPEGIDAVQKVAESLKSYQGQYTLVVTGYTSSTGKAAFNKVLSKRRAVAVSKVLADSGIPADSIKAVGAGFENPIGDNKTKEGQAKNRRVEIDVNAPGAEVTKVETAPTN